MGCFEKVFGSLIGLFFAIMPFFSEGFDGPDKCWCVSSGLIFTILNLLLPYEVFQSLLESIFQSEFFAVIGKWVTIFLISLGVGYVIAGLFFGFDSVQFNIF